MTSRTRGKDAARARAAEMRAEEARAARRRRILLATGAIAAVIVIVGGLVLAKLIGTNDDPTTTAAAPKSSSLSASVLADLTSVPAATRDKVAASGVKTVPASIDAPALTADGKPDVLYIGAEYCPFCAAERWPLVVALSRFGTWSGLSATTSGAEDVFPNTPTVSFHGATFTSDYLTFHGYETQTNKMSGGQYTVLDTVPAADQKVFDSYNKPPYVASAGGIPFLDIAGKYVSSGASYSPELLAGKSLAQIAAALADPSSEIGMAVNANANVLTAAICQETGNEPADVCTSSGVKAGATALAKGQK
jgi:hypothetical protein